MSLAAYRESRLFPQRNDPLDLLLRHFKRTAYLHRRRVGDVAVESFCQLDLVVRVQLRIVPRARQGDVCEAPIHELFGRVLQVHVDEYTVGRLPLAAMTGHRIALIQVWMRLNVEGGATAGIEPHVQLTRCVDLLNGPELTIRHVALG